MKLKNITLLTIAILLACFCCAQKLQFKKNIILKDDQPIGKFEGKATLLNGTDVSILNSEGILLANIKDPLVVYGSPFYEPLRYYSINFISLGEKVAFIPVDKKFFTSEKKLIEYICETIGQDFLTKDGINAEAIKRFMASKNDQSKIIHEDTTRTRNLISLSKEKLKEPLILRPVAPLRLDSYDKKIVSQIWAETFQELDIIQGDVVIGRISKRYKGDPSISTSSSVPPSSSVKYIVMRKVAPFTNMGETVSFINVASLSGTTQYPDLYVDCDKAWSKDLKVGNIFTAEHELISWLIAKGCL